MKQRVHKTLLIPQKDKGLTKTKEINEKILAFVPHLKQINVIFIALLKPRLFVWKKILGFHNKLIQIKQQPLNIKPLKSLSKKKNYRVGLNALIIDVNAATNSW